MKNISYGRHCIDESDIREVTRALKSEWISQGPKIREFEEALATYCSSRYAVAVSSGTAALHLACLAAGLKKGYEAITTPLTFVATANAIIYTRAKPIFADIDGRTYNVNPGQIKRMITRKTRAILPVHFAGLPCDMEAIARIARKKKLIVIEDACHALGAEYRSRNEWINVGSCRHSDMAVFSFQPLKAITTGEGGAITTNNKDLYEKLRVLRSHGIYKTAEMSKVGPWYYEMRDIGFNYRITDFQSGLGLSQLKKIDDFVSKRREIASRYIQAFSGMRGLGLQAVVDTVKHAYHLFLLMVDFEKIGTTRKIFMEQLRQEGILTQVHYIPLYRQPYYQKKFKPLLKKYPVCEEYYRHALSLPIYPTMTDEDINRVIEAVGPLVEAGKQKGKI